MRIAYFTNQYPAVSHTFIRREIRALEALGITISRYALRPGPHLVEADDAAEKAHTNYILQAGMPEMARRCIIAAIKRPLTVFATVVQALKIGRKSDRGLARHLVYVVEAIVLGSWCVRDNVNHIHAHFGTNAAAVAMFASNIFAIPYSFTVHGPEEFDKAPVIALTEKIRKCRFVVAISAYGRSQLCRMVEHSSWQKVKVVHCGLAVSYSAYSEEGVAASRFVCVGRLSEQKGHLILLQAAERLKQLNRKFELMLVGDGEMRAEIETQIDRFGLRDIVKISGWLDGQRVREAISSARALVLPSFAEGLPVVIMEAMALRRPVISTFIAGIPELVRSGEHGWLVPAGDVDALVAAMTACLDATPEAIEAMGRAAQRQVMTRHNLAEQASKLAALFAGNEPDNKRPSKS